MVVAVVSALQTGEETVRKLSFPALTVCIKCVLDKIIYQVAVWLPHCVTTAVSATMAEFIETHTGRKVMLCKGYKYYMIREGKKVKYLGDAYFLQGCTLQELNSEISGPES